MPKWEKKGLLMTKAHADFTHASHPCAVHLMDDNFLIAFSARDAAQHSHIFLMHAQCSSGHITLETPAQCALSPAEAGHFDCHGLLSCCFVRHAGKLYLYYSGWQNLPEGLWLCDTGRAIVDAKTCTAEREFAGPIFARDKHNPLFAAATSVHVSELGQWQAWYNSGLRWQKQADGWQPVYGIHYAHSSNGIDWQSEPGMIIPFKASQEHSFGRPCVVHWDGCYQMWFSCRGAGGCPLYRMGYAHSHDGRQWVRDDSQSGIQPSPGNAWDSESVCYPYLITHDATRYLLYNGNQYGKTGFGYAVMANT